MELSLMRTMGSLERLAVQLLSEDHTVPPHVRQRAIAVLLADQGTQAVQIAPAVDLSVEQVQACLLCFDELGMHALYGSDLRHVELYADLAVG